MGSVSEKLEERLGRQLAVSSSQDAATWRRTSLVGRVWPGLLKAPEVTGAQLIRHGAPQNQHHPSPHWSDGVGFADRAHRRRHRKL